MEPDDIPVHDLLGTDGQPEPGPDELRAIVARAGRRRLQIAAVGAAVALAAGGGIGYGLSNHSSRATQTATAPSSASSPSSGSNPASGSGAGSGAYSSSSSVSASPVAYPPLTRLFTRTTGGITIRGYLLKIPKPMPATGMPAGCAAGPAQLQVEASTAKMVGVAEGWSPGGVQSQLLGVAEGDPTGVVTVATASKVTEVSMSFVGGSTDKMAPVDGWVALAAPVSGTLQYGKPMGTLTESGSGGKVVKSQAVALGDQIGPAMGVPCGGVICPAVGPAQTVPANGGISPGVPAPAIACAVPVCPPPLRQVTPPKGAPVTGAPINGSPAGSASGGAYSGGASTGVASPAGTTVSSPSSSGKASSAYACPRLYPSGAGASSGSGASGSAGSAP